MEKNVSAQGGSAYNGKLPTVLELLQAGVHFGHQKSRWHPKMKEFIFTERSGVHVIDLEKTLARLQIAADFVQNITQKGGVVLFVGTKRQGQAIMKKYAESCGMPSITERWVGGLFTNFAHVSKLIRKYRDLKAKQDAGELDKYTKKEQVTFRKEIERLEKIVGGLGDLTKIPNAIFVLDAKKEKTAVLEAIKRKIPVIAFCDTNIDASQINYPIPSNDDAIKSIEIITKTIAEAVNEGKARVEQK